MSEALYKSDPATQYPSPAILFPRYQSLPALSHGPGKGPRLHETVLEDSRLGCLDLMYIGTRGPEDYLDDAPSPSHTAICPFSVYLFDHIYHSAILLMSESAVHSYNQDKE